MLVILIVIILIILLLGGLPRWPYSRGWGYWPASLLAAILIIVLILWLVGAI